MDGGCKAVVGLGAGQGRELLFRDLADRDPVTAAERFDLTAPLPGTSFQLLYYSAINADNLCRDVAGSLAGEKSY